MFKILLPPYVKLSLKFFSLIVLGNKGLARNLRLRYIPFFVIQHSVCVGMSQQPQQPGDNIISISMRRIFN